MTLPNKEIKGFWNDVACDHINTYEKAQIKDELINLGKLLIPGEFYFYVLNFHNLQIDYVSDSVEEVLGVKPKSFSINTILDSQTKESLDQFKKKEALTADFLFNFLIPDQITDYRVQSILEMKDQEDNFKQILHQVVTLKVSDSGKVEHVLGVHTDISHLNINHSNEVSFIHLKEGTSYYNLSTKSSEFKSTLSFSQQKIVSILSKREVDVLNQIAKGKPSAEVAKNLQISTNTVNTFRRKIIKKLNAKNINEVISKGILDNSITL